jgi:UPF0271 protein
MLEVDLNCDMGESFGAWTLGADAAMMKIITSANIACGWHAGDPLVMERTVRLAREHGVGVGAHPGYPDLLGFGRRSMALSPAEAEAYVLYQVSALAGIARANDTPLVHVKAHGQLYNDAVANPALAEAIARAVVRFDASLILVARPGSALLEAGRAVGLRVAAEAFADRVYEANGTLRSRRLPGAMIEDPARAAEQVLRMVRDGEVVAHDGTVVKLHADTICMHGDGPTAAAIGAELRRRLEAAVVTITPMTQFAQ